LWGYASEIGSARNFEPLFWLPVFSFAFHINIKFIAKTPLLEDREALDVEFIMAANQERPGLPYLATNPSYIFFTDFDGTITQQDSNDFLIEKYGVGFSRRREMFDDILNGRRTFRDAFKDMLDGISLPLNDCIQALLENISLDAGFKDFCAWARENNIPVVVLSGGMEPLIRALLRHLLGEEEAAKLPVVSSGVKARPGRQLEEESGWEISFRDDR
jgi:HAD superfamily phosphoserine phosphatase-like hydrolase